MNPATQLRHSLQKAFKDYEIYLRKYNRNWVVTEVDVDYNRSETKSKLITSSQAAIAQSMKSYFDHEDEYYHLANIITTFALNLNPILVALFDYALDYSWCKIASANDNVKFMELMSEYRCKDLGSFGAATSGFEYTIANWGHLQRNTMFLNIALTIRRQLIQHCLDQNIRLHYISLPYDIRAYYEALQYLPTELKCQTIDEYHELEEKETKEWIFHIVEFVDENKWVVLSSGTRG